MTVETFSLDIYTEQAEAEIQKPFVIRQSGRNRMEDLTTLIGASILVLPLHIGFAVKGVGFALCTTITNGQGDLWNSAREHLWTSAQVPARYYNLALRILNPKAQIGSYRDGNWELRHLRSPLALNITKSFFHLRSQDSFFSHHVGARVAALALRSLLLIENLSLSLISPFAAAASLLTLGRFTVLNNFAYQSLSAPLLYDFFLSRIFLPQKT